MIVNTKVTNDTDDLHMRILGARLEAFIGKTSFENMRTTPPMRTVAQME